MSTALANAAARVVNQASRINGEMLGVETCQVPVELLRQLQGELAKFNAQTNTTTLNIEMSVNREF